MTRRALAGATSPLRRRFLGAAAMSVAAASLARFGAGASGRGPREVAALGKATPWLNSSPLGPAELHGKAVLVDFCTYTCINWLRTLPYRRAWAKKYAGRLVVIGVHTPEFPFEHDLDNVRRAVRQLQIEYPVVIDNDYAVWRAFRNQYWPALYFLDAAGEIRDRHFGEGEYERSERIIQRLLAAAGATGLDTGVVSVEARGVEASADWATLKSPENYLGYARTQGFSSPGGMAREARRRYAAPSRLGLNQWAWSGDWTARRDAVVSHDASGRLVCRCHARDVHLVMKAATPGASGRFRVTLDGQPPGRSHGGDIDPTGEGHIVEPRLYQLIRQSGPVAERTVEIEFLEAGVEAFAFTFG